MKEFRLDFRLKEYSFITMTFIVGLGMLLFFQPIMEETNAEADAHKDTRDKELLAVMAPLTIDVVLVREYLDGEVSEEMIQETIWSMEDFWAYYQDWTLIDQNEEKMIFRKQVNDISPLLKVNGYFGISEDGTLHIYEGIPTDDQIIQSFFQMDTSKLKSKHYSELVKGIPVKNREHYNEVLHVFSAFKTTEKQ